MGYKGRPARDIELADLNGDGDLDMVIVEQNRLTVWLNTGSGLPSAASYTRTVSDGQDVAVGDVNLDGGSDVYVCTGGSGGTNRPDVMLLNDGTGRGFRSIPAP